MTLRSDSAVAADPETPGRFHSQICDGWDIAGNANGGYLLAIAARALTDVTGRPDPVTLSAHYLAPGKPGPATVDGVLARSGRTFATATGALHSGERQLLAVVGTFADLGTVDGPSQVDGAPPEMPPPDACVPIEPTETFPPPFMGRVELRLHPEDAAFALGTPTGVARMRGWFRLRDDEPIDTIALLVAADAFPPTVFNADLPVAWTPTIELTVHVRARPVPGWLACVFTTRFITGGFLEEDGEVWDSSGTLVAQSRQLALVPRS